MACEKRGSEVRDREWGLGGEERSAKKEAGQGVTSEGGRRGWQGMCSHGGAQLSMDHSQGGASRPHQKKQAEGGGWTMDPGAWHRAPSLSLHVPPLCKWAPMPSQDAPKECMT